MGQQQYHTPNLLHSYPQQGVMATQTTHGQLGCGPGPVNVPGMYTYLNQTPLTYDGPQPHHYIYKEGDQRRPRDLSRDRKPYRSSRDSRRRDSRDSRDSRERRYSSQESDLSRRRHGDSHQCHNRNRSRRRSERSPSPTNSGVGRGGGRREKDQSSRREETRGRGRGNQERRESDASYGENS